MSERVLAAIAVTALLLTLTCLVFVFPFNYRDATYPDYPGDPVPGILEDACHSEIDHCNMRCTRKEVLLEEN